MRVGLVYLLDATSSDACIRLSEELTSQRRARVVLGPAALPHVSLVHVETDRPSALWAEAVASVPQRISMRFAALAFLRYEVPYNAPIQDADSAADMAYAIIPCTAALRRAEARALALPTVDTLGTTTGNGDRFLPHVTLAIWEGDAAPARWTMPRAMLDAELSGRLALGVIGPNGTYQRTLFGE